MKEDNREKFESCMGQLVDTEKVKEELFKDLPEEPESRRATVFLDQKNRLFNGKRYSNITSCFLYL